MKKELIKLANHLDRIGRTKEADYIDQILKEADFEYNIKSLLSEISRPFKTPAATLARKQELMRERTDREFSRTQNAKRKALTDYIIAELRNAAQTGIAVSSLEAIKAAVDSAFQVHKDTDDYEPERTGFLNLIPGRKLDGQPGIPEAGGSEE